jgi:hypothetical protein
MSKSSTVRVLTSSFPGPGYDCAREVALTGYHPTSEYDQIGGRPAHRVVWEDAHGPIPQGYHIHHIDLDTHNNALDNLACLSPSEHAQLHAKQSAPRRAARKSKAHHNNPKDAALGNMLRALYRQ